jgi:hypothetical protein
MREDKEAEARFRESSFRLGQSFAASSYRKAN